MIVTLTSTTVCCIVLLLSCATTRMVGVAAWNLPSRRRYTPYPQQKQQQQKQQLYTCNRGSSIGGTCFRFVSHQSSPQPSSFGLKTMILQSTANYDSSRGEENESKEPNTSTDSDDEEEACTGGNNDDEECEIDWSKMPGFADEDDVQDDVAQLESTSGIGSSNDYDSLRTKLESQFQNQQVTSVKTPDVVDSPSSLHSTTSNDRQISASSSMSSDWKRLEMIWQQREAATECDVYEPITCGGHVCSTCSGSGTSICRFCRGTKFLYLPVSRDEVSVDATVTLQQHSKSYQPFVSCSICHTTGIEMCRSCQGSGWIADWTQMGVRTGAINAVPKPPSNGTWLE